MSLPLPIRMLRQRILFTALLVAMADLLFVEALVALVLWVAFPRLVEGQRRSMVLGAGVVVTFLLACVFEIRRRWRSPGYLAKALDDRNQDARAVPLSAG